MSKNKWLAVLAFVTVAGCNRLGATIPPAEALSRQQVAASARATALSCAEPPTLTQNPGSATRCSESDTATCVQRITAAATCEAINAAYLACPVRCQ